jgi:hypothetical protein
MREPQKVKRLRLTFSSSFSVLFGKPPEFDPARLVGVEFQPKLRESFPQILQVTVCIRLVLKSRYGVIGVSNDHHFASRPLLAPATNDDVMMPG